MKINDVESRGRSQKLKSSFLANWIRVLLPTVAELMKLESFLGGELPAVRLRKNATSISVVLCLN
jgi:hypothetical protein